MAPTLSARSAMLQASHLAGRAIDVSQTTACHALSYPLTSRWGVPHGKAVGLMLRPVWRFNSAITDADANDERGANFVLRVMRLTALAVGVVTIGQVPDAIEEMWRTLGAPLTFAECGIDPAAAVAQIQLEMDPSRGGNNPRQLPRESISQILGELT